MTWGQVFKSLIRLGFSLTRSLVMFIIFLLMTVFRFVVNLMSDHEDIPPGHEDAEKLEAATHAGKFGAHLHPTTAPSTPTLLRDYTKTSTLHDVDAFGIHIHHTDSRGHSPATAGLTKDNFTFFINFL